MGLKVNIETSIKSEMIVHDSYYSLLSLCFLTPTAIFYMLSLDNDFLQRTLMFQIIFY